MAGLNVAFLEQTSNSSDTEIDELSGRSFSEAIGAREKKFWSVEVSAYFQTKFKTLNVYYRLSILCLRFHDDSDSVDGFIDMLNFGNHSEEVSDDPQDEEPNPFNIDMNTGSLAPTADLP